LFGTKADGPSAFVSNSIFAGEGAISGDPGDRGSIFLTHSVIPPDTFPRKNFKDVGGNVADRAPTLVDLEPGLSLYALDATSRAVGIADVTRIPPGALDILGVPLVHGGRASPGALVQPALRAS
jgi:hypothetical protein